MKVPSLGVRRILPKKIWQQIFFIVFFLTAIPLVILWFLLLQTSQNTVKTTVLRDYKEIAVHATGEIREHIKGAQETLFVVASILGTLHADPWRQETAIVELSLKNSAFKRISSVNIKGNEIATSELGTKLRDRANDKAFQEAASGKSYLSEVKISENHIPFLTLAEPIKQSGKVKGVLIADLNVRSVWNIVDDIQIGRLGMAYLVDQKGRIIAHHDKKLVLKNANLTHTQGMRDVLRGQTGSFEEIDEKGEAWLTSYAPIEQLRWGLIITQPEKEAFAFLKKMNEQFLAIIVFGIPTALLISFILTHYLSRPIKGMIEGTKRISKGDFSYSFQIRGKNEIDKLLFSFNRMTHKLRKAQENEKLSIIGKAATAIAHELKNSLQLISAFVKELPKRHDDENFIKEFSDTIPGELDSWNTSLGNMMTFAKNSQFSAHELDINEVVGEMMLLTRLKARQLDIRLEVDLEEGLPLITGNKEKLKQVLLNIVTNALDATPSGGRIIMTTRAVNKLNSGGPGFVEIDIMNTGKGIDKNDLDKIFEPFFSTKTEGLGLGLSISKEIIDYHQGSIKVASERDKETVFVISLPANSRKKSVMA